MKGKPSLSPHARVWRHVPPTHKCPANTRAGRKHYTDLKAALAVAGREIIGNSETLGMTSPAPQSMSMALALLMSHQPRILVIPEKEPLDVPLEMLNIKCPSRCAEKNVDMMFVGPDESEENRGLRAVCGACLSMAISVTLFHH